MTVAREIAERTVQFNDEGFMIDPNEWAKPVAIELAKVVGIDDLNERHWKVIEFSRESYDEHGESPTLRRIKANSGVAVKELYKLFPKKPAKKIAFIAGLPKPTGCV
ncbi:MAG: TusE/DsrC/DsvC family sulfur relay protein [Cellvibrionaceae bacterium]|jgi:TusE/DsrC/DsvC family sulfur relay protein